MIRVYDVDGVVADFNSGYRQLLKEEFGLVFPPISDTYPTEWNWAKLGPVSQDIAWGIIQRGNFWATLKPLPECREALELAMEQRREGDHIYFVTDRPGQWAKQLTEEWLEQYGFWRPTVIISAQKGLICNGLKADVFVDDKPENCWAAAMYHPKRKVYLVDRPYNQAVGNFPDMPNIERVTSILDPRVMPKPLREAA